MRSYEVVVILDATLEEEAIRPVLDRAMAPITKDGGKVTTDRWGKRRFAYELKHRWEGYYVVLQTRAEPAAMEELHRVLSLADEVLRHKILRIPEQVYGKLAGAAPERASRTAPEPAASVPEAVSVPEPAASVVEPAGSEPERGESEPEPAAEATVTDA
jgi:small subunit ribosomal protein S6